MINDFIWGANDTPQVDDRLGIDRYKDGLASFIEKCDTPMTISIQGQWGSGKTSVMKMIDRKLKENMGEKYFPIWFDTWKYGNGMENKLTFILMRHFYQALLKNISDPKTRQEMEKKNPRIAENAMRFAFDIAESALGNVTGEIAAHRIRNIVDFKHKFTSEEDAVSTEEEIDYAAEIACTKEKIQDCVYLLLTGKSKEEYEKYCVENHIDTKPEGRVVVFVDDLDRLEPKVAVELLEGIKNFIDCELCVFVLAVDDSVIYQGVKSKYGEGVTNEKAKSFFDKIIQVPFLMPVQTYNIRTYIEPFLGDEKDYSQNFSRVLSRYEYIISSMVKDRNPRNIKRIFNVFDLYKVVYGQDALEEENTKLCLLIIVAMQLTNRDLYEDCIEKAVKGELLTFIDENSQQENRSDVEMLDNVIMHFADVFEENASETNTSENNGSVSGTNSSSMDNETDGRVKMVERIEELLLKSASKPEVIFKGGSSGFKELRRRLVEELELEEKGMDNDQQIIFTKNGKKVLMFNYKEDSQTTNLVMYGERLKEKFGDAGYSIWGNANHSTVKNIKEEDPKLFEALKRCFG